MTPTLKYRLNQHSCRTASPKRFFARFASLVFGFLLPWLGSSLFAQEPGADLGEVLKRICDDYDFAGPDAAQERVKLHGLRVEHDGAEFRIPVILEPVERQSPEEIDTNGFSELGIRVDARSRSFLRIMVPPNSLRDLERHPGVRIARIPTPATASTGPDLSESTGLTGADVMHGAGITGVGVKVAVVDLGFIGLAARISEGNLAANTVTVDFAWKQ